MYVREISYTIMCSLRFLWLVRGRTASLFPPFDLPAERDLSDNHASVNLTSLRKFSILNIGLWITGLSPDLDFSTPASPPQPPLPQIYGVIILTGTRRLLGG